LAALPLFKAQSKTISLDDGVLEKVAEFELAMAALEKGSVSDMQVGFENSSVVTIEYVSHLCSNKCSIG
jgi:hypothetical protein